ncbi:hypothetical protein NA56DRAFT_647009 [Hyaloscypha hepaticicola]|uniref:Cora-domain-containing protein n=1 Tax=Hyaloscypha hepaticicola TaxID=2082293 RepID=A0A2J6Q0H7_9HELO|nr:hypothetical protein NA56DRAFT_647009 [Hyaloscypha hepaticicola]
MNTWNFTDSNSIPHRGLPSVCTPEQSFTLRYYEIRTLDDPKSINDLTIQMTFAVNRRWYEMWRDIDLPLSVIKDKRHAFIRRCASFWTSQDPDQKDQGWDALLLVDPGMECVKVGPNTTYILKDPETYDDRTGLWNAHDWNSEQHVEPKEHKSFTYHDGCPTLAQPFFSQISDQAQTQMANLQAQRDLASPLDEQVFYWTKVASKDLIQKTNKQSSNAAYYLLKHIAQHWTNQLELINCTIAKGEYLSDDYQATIGDNLSQQQWKSDLIQVNQVTKDINYMRRQMNHFWRAMILNLERLGVQLGGEQVDTKLSLALQGAQKDLLSIHTRMQLLRERGEALTAIANNLANLHAAFRGIHDSEFGLRLSLVASIVFPLTLVASIFSMSSDYLPGAKAFWKFWAISIPSVAIFALALVYGTRPYWVLRDAKKYVFISYQRLKQQARKKNNVDNIREKQTPKKGIKRHISLC